MKLKYPLAECQAFAQCASDMGRAMQTMDGLVFYGDAMIRASDIIFDLLEVINMGGAISPDDEKQKEISLGENEKRDIPPTPPIESKAKEVTLKKDHTQKHKARATRVCARACEEEQDVNRLADETFEAFWSKYPAGHKVDKQKCKQKLRTIFSGFRNGEKLKNSILHGLDQWLQSQRWVDNFVCNPYKWLNMRRWEDSPERSPHCEDREAEEARAKSNAESEEILKRLGL